jgi:hypothetical protein
MANEYRIFVSIFLGISAEMEIGGRNNGTTIGGEKGGG